MIKIEEWEDLDTVQNEHFKILVGNERIYIYKTPCDHNTASLSLLYPAMHTEEFATGWLEYFGFHVKFAKPPLKKVKEEIQKENRYAFDKSCQVDNDDTNQKYWESRCDLCAKLLDFIERIEKDD
jgi:hypothetical protein